MPPKLKPSARRATASVPTQYAQMAAALSNDREVSLRQSDEMLRGLIYTQPQPYQCLSGPRRSGCKPGTEDGDGGGHAEENHLQYCHEILRLMSYLLPLAFICAEPTLRLTFVFSCLGQRAGRTPNRGRLSPASSRLRSSRAPEGTRPKPRAKPLQRSWRFITDDHSRDSRANGNITSEC